MLHELMKHTKSPKRRLSLHYFESIQEGFAYVEHLSQDETLKHDHRERIVGYIARHESDWTGCTSPEQFAERVKMGWAEGADRLRQLGVPELHPTSVRRRRTRSDQGDDLDIHAVYRGDLSRAWTRTRRQTRSGTNRAVTVVCNICASAGVSADKLFWRGASALRVAEALEEAGYNVRIVAGMGGKNCDEKGHIDHAALWEVKASDQPLDVPDLAAILCLSGYFRVAGFASIVDGCDKAGACAAGGLGQPSQNSLTLAIDRFIPDSLVIVQPENVLNEQVAAEWVREALAQVERPLEEAA